MTQISYRHIEKPYRIIQYISEFCEIRVFFWGQTHWLRQHIALLKKKLVALTLDFLLKANRKQSYSLSWTNISRTVFLTSVWLNTVLGPIRALNTGLLLESNLESRGCTCGSNNGHRALSISDRLQSDLKIVSQIDFCNLHWPETGLFRIYIGTTYLPGAPRVCFLF